MRRIGAFQPDTQIHDVWRRFISSMGYPAEITDPLLSADGLMEMLDGFPVGMARQFHACTHTTFSPNIVHGGSKINMIPDMVELEVDIRTLPGQTDEDIQALLAMALGDLADRVEIVVESSDMSSASPLDTPLWDTLSRVTQRFYEGSATVPYLTVGATDARFFRRKGITVLRLSACSASSMTFEDYGSMFHGDDERIDIESLGLSVELWDLVARDLLS